jgi:hypothetical protein
METLTSLGTEQTSKEFVRCCDITRASDLIYIEQASIYFRYAGDGKEIVFCPWCGTLLDLNLEMD